MTMVGNDLQARRRRRHLRQGRAERARRRRPADAADRPDDGGRDAGVSRVAVNAVASRYSRSLGSPVVRRAARATSRNNSRYACSGLLRLRSSRALRTSWRRCWRSARGMQREVGQRRVAFGDQAIAPGFDAVQRGRFAARRFAVVVERVADRVQRRRRLRGASAWPGTASWRLCAMCEVMRLRRRRMCGSRSSGSGSLASCASLSATSLLAQLAARPARRAAARCGWGRGIRRCRVACRASPLSRSSWP